MWKSLKESFETPDSYVSLALGLAVVLVVGMITFNYFKAKMQPGTAGSDPKTEVTQENTTSLPTKHTVASGDTLWSIAEKYYKSGYNWVDVQKANNVVNPDDIAEGQVLTIPDAKPITVPAGQVSSASTGTLEKKAYTVVHGDSLWSIAVKTYNDGYKWTDIAQANSLTTPDVIHAGNVLTLP